MDTATHPPLARGLWGVLATPFAGLDLAVDVDSLRREVSLFTRARLTGLVALGVFGEAAALDSAEQALVARTVAEAAGPTPLVVGLSARTTAMAVEQARTAVGAAGDRLAALMVQVNSADPDVVVRHLGAVHEASGAGIVLQDYPVASGLQVGAAQLVATVERCPFVVAVKSEAPPTAAAIAELTARLSIPVYGGLGGLGLLDELMAGAAGAMTGFSHPEALGETLAAWDDAGYAGAREAYAHWLPLVNFEAQPGIGMALRKEVLRRRGVFADAAVRPPTRPLPASLLDALATHLDAVDLRVGA